MNITSIISITGKPGLHKIVSQTKNGLIAESIEDGKRFPVYASEKVSAIEDISIYTKTDDMPLVEVYQKLYKKTAGKAAIDHKSKPEELQSFLKEVVDFDEERVYNSDLKKLFQWFNILIKADLLKEEEKEEKSTKKATADKKDAKAPKKVAPAKKVTAKKTTTPKTSKAKATTKTATPSKKG